MTSRSEEQVIVTTLRNESLTYDYSRVRLSARARLAWIVLRGGVFSIKLGEVRVEARDERKPPEAIREEIRRKLGGKDAASGETNKENP